MSSDAHIPRRLPHAEAVSQLRQAQSLQTGAVTLDSPGVPIAVVNRQRQVIYANHAFQELIGALTVEELCGQRPGEVLGCIHAEAGCGESESCRFCGAAQAIIETQRTGQAAARECHITLCTPARGPSRGPALDFLVRTTPFEIAGGPFVLVSLIDISSQKRRLSLERLFFHDILNTTSSFKVYLSLLRQGTTAGRSLQLIERLQDICGTLEEEINGQKVMMSAEGGTLQVQRDLIESSALAAQVADQCRGLEIARGRRIVIEPFSESFTFVSDDALVKRIIGNMVKNALEASAEGAVVSMALRLEGAERVRFEVRNASFIEAEVQKHIFRRYFSTKGENRGLGTWGMRLLAEDYLGGRVSFTTDETAGTTFVLSLPRRSADQASNPVIQ